MTPTATGYRIINSNNTSDVYELREGDVITLTRTEAKGDGVKAGYDYGIFLVKNDGTIVDESTSTFPYTHTVSADEILISIYYRY